MCGRCVCLNCGEPYPILIAAIGTDTYGIEQLVCEACGGSYEQIFMERAVSN